MDINIRRETEHDYPNIKAVNDEAFNGTAESDLIEKLRKKEDFLPELSLVAEDEGKIIGHILFFPVSIKTKDGECVSLSLAPMAVLPDRQKKGVGAKLIKEGFKRAKEMGYKSVVVLGYPEYYKKFGFKPADNWGLKSPFKDAQPNAFMAIELNEGELEDKAGEVIFPDEYHLTV